MKEQLLTAQLGRVASLHLHPRESGKPLQSVEIIEVIPDKGILGNGRYFDRTSRSTSKPSRRQVSLIAREQIAEHATALGLESIGSGVVRSNIETTDVDLMKLVGCNVQVGEAILHFYEARTPCSKMDAICLGLRNLMQNNRQGVLAEVIRPGKIRVGDVIHRNAIELRRSESQEKESPAIKSG
jgi:hypothetical protein